MDVAREPTVADTLGWLALVVAILVLMLPALAVSWCWGRAKSLILGVSA